MNQDELFKNAVEEYGKMIFRVCSHFFGSRDNAKDAYQETLLKIWLNIKSFRGEASLKTWIYRIAVNVCITYLLKVKRNRSLFVPITKTVFNNSTTDGEIYKEEKGKLQFFRGFVDNLPASDKALVSLYLEDLDTKEMSVITGLSESNVRVRIHRIKNQIKNEWKLKHGT